METKFIRIKNLDNIRLLMCVVVFVSHLEFLKNDPIISNFYTKCLHNATFAVDYFFLLSGFGLFYTNKIQDSTVFAFVKTKLKKIYKPFVVSILINLPTIFLYFKNTIISFGARQAIIKFVFSSVTNLTLTQSLICSSELSGIYNGVTWYLSCLFISYFFSKHMYKMTQKKESVKESLFTILLTIMSIIIMSMAAEKIDKIGIVIAGFCIDGVWYQCAFIRIHYIYLGMLIADLFNKTKKEIKNNKAKIIADSVTAICIIYSILRNSINININVLRFVDITLCSAFLYFMAFEKGIFAKIISNENINKLSKNTLLIYLFHYPIKNVIHMIFKYVFNSMGFLMNIVQVLLIIAFTLLFVFIYNKHFANNVIYGKEK